MLTTSQQMAIKLKEAISIAKVTQTQVATACGVTKQAVQGWVKTGRFDKKHLPTLAAITGKPLEWWLDIASDNAAATEEEKILAALQDWRMQASQKSREVIDQLGVLAQKNALRDEDWKLIEQMAARLRRSQN